VKWKKWLHSFFESMMISLGDSPWFSFTGRWEGGLSWTGLGWAAGSRMCYGFERSRMSFSLKESLITYLPCVWSHACA
jgi:hypothetical protein